MLRVLTNQFSHNALHSDRYLTSQIRILNNRQAKMLYDIILNLHSWVNPAVKDTGMIPFSQIKGSTASCRLRLDFIPLATGTVSFVS